MPRNIYLNPSMRHATAASSLSKL